MLPVLNNVHFNLCSVKVRSLLSTMALFHSTYISLPTTVVLLLNNFMILMIKRLPTILSIVLFSTLSGLKFMIQMINTLSGLPHCRGVYRKRGGRGGSCPPPTFCQ